VDLQVAALMTYKFKTPTLYNLEMQFSGHGLHLLVSKLLRYKMIFIARC
jgi:hypothetical protein